MSQKKLGIEAGLDPSVASPRMNQYEKGTHLPDINTLTKICNVLDVPVAHLYCEDDELAYVIANFHKMDLPTRKKIIDLIEMTNIGE